MSDLIYEWRSAVGYPKYWVSNYGDIYREATIDKAGRRLQLRYLKVIDGSVRLQIDGHSIKQPIGRLILLSFIGASPYKNKCLARHLDDNRSNNKLDNLAWGDHSDNMADALRNGRRIVTEKTKQKLRIAMVGNRNSIGRRSMESRLRISLSRRGKLNSLPPSSAGKVWITNKSDNKLIYLSQPLPDGWAYGRSLVNRSVNGRFQNRL